MYKFSAAIYGTIRGPIWWPAGQECEKQFSYIVKDGSHFTDSKKESLRNAILRIKNDGDFQSCDLLADSILVVTLHKEHGQYKKRWFNLYNPLFPSIQDCIIDSYPIFGLWSS